MNAKNGVGAMQVANGELPNTEETAERVFCNVYTAIYACYERTHRQEEPAEQS